MILNALLKTTMLTGALGAAIACAVPAAAQIAPAQPASGLGGFEAGKDYRVLSPPQSTSSASDRVEVAEIFMFGCPGCFGLEPHLEMWLPTKPDYVSFVRIPAVWNAVAELHARAYYTAQTLGKSDEFAGPFFDEVHKKGNPLNTLDALAEFFGRFGVDGKAFRDTFYSPAIDAKLARAQELVKNYGVSSTPTLVVNGKYVTTGSMAGTYGRWFAIIESLAASEHIGGRAKP